MKQLVSVSVVVVITSREHDRGLAARGGADPRIATKRPPDRAPARNERAGQQRAVKRATDARARARQDCMMRSALYTPRLAHYSCGTGALLRTLPGDLPQSDLAPCAPISIWPTCCFSFCSGAAVALTR